MTSTWRHLARRFFSFGTARPLDESERATIENWLPESALRDLFFSQPPGDQRHGHDAGVAAAGHHPDRPEFIRAAALHDIGKQASGLGIWGRSLASGFAKLGVHVAGRWEIYTAHGPIGAAQLEALGAEPLVIDYTRHHHGSRPDGVSEDDWRRLVDIDQRY